MSFFFLLRPFTSFNDLIRGAFKGQRGAMDYGFFFHRLVAIACRVTQNVELLHISCKDEAK